MDVNVILIPSRQACQWVWFYSKGKKLKDNRPNSQERSKAKESLQDKKTSQIKTKETRILGTRAKPN